MKTVPVGVRELADLLEVYVAALDWVRRRNALSADCKALGISSSYEDTGRWLHELDRREEPFRKLMEKHAWPKGGTS